MKYQLIDYYDVYEEGEEYNWVVNNLSRTDTYIDIEENDNEATIIKKLVDLDYFLRTATDKTVRVEWYDFMIEMFDAETDEPLCRLERTNG